MTSGPMPTMIVVDDFLTDPVVARNAALALPYAEPGKENYAGVVSQAPLRIAGLDAAISKLAGTPLVGAAGTLHGHCRLTPGNAKGASGVHVDPAAYSGILFLSLPEHCKGGTDFFQHRQTGLDRVPNDWMTMTKAGFADMDSLVETVVNRDTTKPARWERLFTVPMRFNRLLLFSPWLFHNARPGFGDRPENSRLVQLMFFARA